MALEQKDQTLQSCSVNPQSPPISPAATTLPCATVKPFRVSSISVGKIDSAGGMEYVIAAVLEGHTHAQIAEGLGICRSDLGAYLHNQNDPDYHRAMAASSDALLDRAEDLLLQAKGGSMADVQIAKELAQLCYRRAGIRNALFRDRISQATAITLTAPEAPAEIPRFVITIAEPLPASAYGRTIDHDPDR